MPSKDEFFDLLTRYTNGKCTKEEERSLFELIDSGDYSDVLSAHFDASISSTFMATSKISPDRAEEIMKRILYSEKQTVSLISTKDKRRISSRFWWASAAAAAILIVCLATFMYISNSSSALSIKEVASLQDDPQVLENSSDHPVAFTLEDGSEVVLEPGAVLNCPKRFLSDKREVHLEGEAFFQIKKSAGRPFFVYHNKLVTQVLGTSFNIRINRDSDMVEVNVVTGRVQVSEWVKRKGSEKPETNGVIVTPNQKAIYNNENRQFVTSLVDIPMPVISEDSLLSNDGSNRLVYDNTPLPEVLSVLRDIYKVDIIVENDNLNNCFFTGDLTNRNLFNNLDLLATVISANYEIKGTNILLKGRGCAFR